jgi:hypothetical protein
MIFNSHSSSEISWRAMNNSEGEIGQILVEAMVRK